MKVLNLMGDVQELEAGLSELSQDLNFMISESGIDVHVTQKDGADLCVDFKESEANIVYDKKIHFFRAFSLLMQHLEKSNKELHLVEKPQFDLNGPMFDVSQGNAVIKVTEVKSVLRQMA